MLTIIDKSIVSKIKKLRKRMSLRKIGKQVGCSHEYIRLLEKGLIFRADIDLIKKIKDIK